MIASRLGSRWQHVLVLLLSGLGGLGHAAEPAADKPLSPDLLKRLSERDPLKEKGREAFAAGKLEEQVALIERAVAIEREVLGELHPDTIGSVQYLALLAALRGQHDPAVQQLQGLVNRLKEQGPDDHWQIRSTRLALLQVEKIGKLDSEGRKRVMEQLQRMDQSGRLIGEYKYADAIPPTKLAIASLKELLGDDDPAYLVVLGNLGWCHRELGDLDAAEPILREVLAKQQELLGEDHPRVATAKSSLAWVYGRRKEWPQAKALLREAGAILRASQGKAGFAYIRNLNYLSEMYVLMGDRARAQAIRAEMVELYAQSRGKQDPLYASSLYDLALTYTSMGDNAKAEPLLAESVEILKQHVAANPVWYSNSLAELSYVYQQLGKYDQAIAIQLEALELFRRIWGPDDLQTAGQLSRLGSVFYSAGNYSKSLEHARLALEVYRKKVGEADPKFKNTLGNIAIILSTNADVAHDRDDFAASLAAASEALDVRRKLLGADHWQVTNTRLDLAYKKQLAEMAAAQRAELRQAQALRTKANQARQSNPREALALVEQALEVYRRLLGDKHQATISGMFAVVYMRLSAAARDESEPLLTAMPDLVREVLGMNHPDYATSLHNLASFRQARGDFQQAVSLLEQSLAVTRKISGEMHDDVANTLSGLAHSNAFLGNYEQAEAHFSQALEMRRKLSGEMSEKYANSLLNLAVFYHDQLGDFATAEEYFLKAKAIYKQTTGEQSQGFATSLASLAVLYTDLGQMERAEPLHQQALAIRKSVVGESHIEYAFSLFGLATLYNDTGRPEQAEPLVSQAVAILQQANGKRHPNVASFLEGLAAVDRQLGKFDAAAEADAQAIEIHRLVSGEQSERYANSLSRSALTQYFLGHRARATQQATEALRIANRYMEHTALFQSERQQLAMRKRVWSAMDNFLFVTANEQGNDQAVYDEVLNWKGAVTARQSDMRRWNSATQTAANSQVGKLKSALSDAARTLAMETRRPEGDSERPFRIRDLSGRIEKLQAELAQQSAELRKQIERRTRSADDVRRALPDDVVLIDLLGYQARRTAKQSPDKRRSEDMLLAFIVSRDKPVVRVELGPAKPIEQAIQDWRAAYGRKSGDADPGAQLRALVWQPLVGHLAKAKTIAISPNGITAAMPWSALPGDKPGTYLIEERALVLVPIPRLLPELLAANAAQSGPSAASLLLVGDVDFGSPAAANATVAAATRSSPRGGQLDWSPLPGTRDEVAAIKATFAEQFDVKNATQLTHERATKTAVRDAAGKFQFLHFSTHGFFAPPQYASAADSQGAPSGSASEPPLALFHPGLLSGLVFAGANRAAGDGADDCVLTALEVAEMDLDGVQLATLSACETGLGESAGGEGLLGLQRAFQSAGARSVVGGLWKVPDKATQLLMTRFYRNLWERKLTKLEALREAQLWMIREAPKQPDLLRGLTVDSPTSTANVPPGEMSPTTGQRSCSAEIGAKANGSERPADR